MATSDYRLTWDGVQTIPGIDYTCAYCGREVGSVSGWQGTGRFLTQRGEVESIDGSTPYWVAACPRCGRPTFFAGDQQIPGSGFGEDVDHLPADVDRLYDEARRCMTVGAYNAAVMVGRKLLMNVASTRGAPAGQSFKAYVSFLEEQQAITGDMKPWIDEIRELGNDAVHELPDMARDEAEALLTFVAMLLKIVYEYPERGRRSVAARAAKS